MAHFKNYYTTSVRAGNLNNYFSLHNFLCFRLSVRPLRFTIFAIVSENDNSKSCLISVKSKKYAFQVTLRPLRSMRGGKSELRTLRYHTRRSQAAYNKTHFSVTSSPQCWSQAVVCINEPRMCPRSGFSQYRQNSKCAKTILK